MLLKPNTKKKLKKTHQHTKIKIWEQKCSWNFVYCGMYISFCKGVVLVTFSYTYLVGRQGNLHLLLWQPLAALISNGARIGWLHLYPPLEIRRLGCNFFYLHRPTRLCLLSIFFSDFINVCMCVYIQVVKVQQTKCLQFTKALWC